MEKFKSIKDVFSLVKLEPFLARYTTIKARGGFYHRVNGKSTSGQPKSLTDDDREQVGKAIDLLITDLQEAKSLLKVSE